MPKLRFALALPIIQVVMAFLMMERAKYEHSPGGAEYFVPTSWLICRGLNAPALLLSALNPEGLGVSRERLSPSIDIGNLLFLVGVAATWFLAGWALDRRGQTSIFSRHWVVGIIAKLLLLALAGLLFIGALRDFRNPITPFAPLGASLMLAWSLALILISIRSFIKAIGPTRC